MRKFTIFLAMLFFINVAAAQEIKAEVSYTYLFANQWDKAIQTYNFSRPWLAENQPLFTNGLKVSATKTYGSSTPFSHGYSLSYAYFGSLAENENATLKLNLHFLKMGYVLHYENTERSLPLYVDFSLCASSSFLMRKQDGTPFIYDEAWSKAFGMGGELGLKLGYRIKPTERFQFSPFIEIGCTPFFFSPNTEAVINQTKSLAGKPWTAMLHAQSGIAFHFKR
ncbi:MAG: hypothetical protein EBR91_10775 [Flavobacteriia bacterium]|nr:hypothetical protein [Flavobacteriia bacterium]NBV92637.1 hypothetical protein [Flavobacteriia bacterium]